MLDEPAVPQPFVINDWWAAAMISTACCLSAGVSGATIAFFYECLFG